MPEEYKEVIPLTDPVVPDISQKSSYPPPPPSPKQEKPPVPASVPSSRTGKGPITAPLVIITLLAVVVTSFFYYQTQHLKKQVQDLSNTLEAQKIAPVTEPTPQATPEPTISIPQVSTPSATPQTQTEIQQALSLAQQKYKDAQLILIISDNPHLEGQQVTKYWFRQSADTKTYLYVSFVAGQSSLVDQQVYVSPDSNIPSLNQRIKDNQLGLTQTQALSLANSLCKDKEKCQNATAIKTQFLDTGNSLLWQITYQIEGSSQPTVFQINSLTKEVVYQSQK
jgi:hypothetical protein